jgi:hypothetical protein
MEASRLGTREITRNQTRRNRAIAIAAGAVTVVAIVLGFAGDFLGMPWHWMRPAAELLLLAELVGLVVLERHQLFEPVHDGVSDLRMRIADLQMAVGSITEHLGASGQVTVCPTTPELFRALTRVTREALARDYEGPQILRIAALSGIMFAEDNREGATEFRDYFSVALAYLLAGDSPQDSRARRWSFRMLIRFANAEGFDRTMQMFAPGIELNPINVEIKMFTRAKVESGLSPQTITDREVVLAFDDANAALRWGLLFEGRQYAGLFARWFDDLWASIPDANLVYSRNGLNQKAIDLIRKELGAPEASQARQTA